MVAQFYSKSFPDPGKDAEVWAKMTWLQSVTCGVPHHTYRARKRAKFGNFVVIMDGKLGIRSTALLAILLTGQALLKTRV